MNKNPKLHKYYDSSDPNLTTLRFKKRQDLDRTKRIVVRLALVFLFLLVEGVVMWASADAKVIYNPSSPEIVIDVRPPKPISKINFNIEKPPLPLPLLAADMYLIIPSLLINAPIDSVGTTTNGEMATSQSLERVAWYKDGTKPGDVGSSVFAGHYGNPDESGVFRSIGKLKEGDSLEVRNKTGSIVKYKVYKLGTYSIADVPLQELFNKKDGKYLNLVTCVGNWNNATSSYDQRLIVFARLAE